MKPNSPPEPDENGNVVHIDNPENYQIDIEGRNNTVRVKNINVGSRVIIRIRGDENVIDIGRCILKEFSISIGSHDVTRGAKITIGDHFSIEPGGKIELYTNFGEISIGNNCLFSRDITFHFGDNPHLIFDEKTGAYIDGDGKVSIGNKVWIGEGCYLSKRAVVSDESIVAARSVVTRRFPDPHCVIGGNPSRVVKKGIQWFRNRSTIPASTIYASEIEVYDRNVADDIPPEPAPQRTRKGTWGSQWPAGTTCLFGVGAMKAGTSYLHDYLLSHPDVHFGRLKEVHYFDVLDFPSEQHHFKSKVSVLAERVDALSSTTPDTFQKNIQAVENSLSNLRIYKNASGDHQEYREFLLHGFKAQKVVGDITPSYCKLSVDRLSGMYQLAPSVKFLFVMRDPIDRLWSAVRMHARQQKGDFAQVCSAVSKRIAADRDNYMLTRSDYKSIIENLKAVAPSEDIHFMFYESMFLQSARNALCDFLEIPHKKGSDTKRVNPGLPQDLPDDIRDTFYDILKPQYDFVFSNFEGQVPETWYRGQ